MTDAVRMPFGQFEGTPLREIPAPYLDWLHAQPWITRRPDVLDWLDANRADIDYELKQRDQARERKAARDGGTGDD